MASMRNLLLFLAWLLPVLMVGGIVCQAPAWLEPQTLTVTLEPGQTLKLGHEALKAPQADREHVLLQRTLDGSWRLANIAPNKQVLWRPADSHEERSIREWLLIAGTTFAVGTQRITVLAAEADRLLLQAADQRWQYDGVVLRRADQRLPECYENWRARLRDSFAALGLGRWVQRPLRLGGGVYCADRLGLAEASVDTALIVATRSGFVLRPGNGGRLDGPPVTILADTPEAESLWQRSILLAVNDWLLIGRTQYRVAQMDSTSLKLVVLTRAQRRLADATADTVAEVQTQWRPMIWWTTPIWLKWLLTGLAICWASAFWWRWRADDLLWIAVSLTLAGASLALYFEVQSMPSLWPYLLAWPTLGVWLMGVRSLWSAGLLATLTLLLGAGLATLLQLGVGVSDSGWWRYGSGSAALTGVFGWLAWAVWRFWHVWRPQRATQVRLARWGLRLLGGMALTLLALQAGFGDESGWCSLQPFELVKLALTLAAAHALAPIAQWRWRDGHLAKPVLWLSVAGPIILLLAATGFSLVFLHDFSPLALLFIWVLGLAWALLQVQPHAVWRWSGGLLVAALTLTLAMGVMRLRERPEDFPLNFQVDRIRVWAAPERYPHAGYQLRRALEAIRAGGWWGAVWQEAMNGRAMAIPVVESDFAPAFFLNRYGGVAALILVGAQAMFVLLLIGVANRVLRSNHHNSYVEFLPGGFSYFALYGSAALLGAHFLVSWGTNLGFLPVMGQPMPLLSAAGSHLTFFVLPIVALAVAVEEGNDGDLP